jgi:hypothetical protein
MTIERLLAFGDAWNRRDVDDIMSYLAVECTYHASAGPEPGRTYEGREAVRRGVTKCWRMTEAVGPRPVQRSLPMSAALPNSPTSSQPPTEW